MSGTLATVDMPLISRLEPFVVDTRCAQKVIPHGRDLSEMCVCLLVVDIVEGGGVDEDARQNGF